MFPSRRSHTFLVGLILVDLPVLAAVAVVGAFAGYRHTYTVVTDWRLAHPWSLLPSVMLAGWLAWRWVRSHPAPPRRLS